eukprot:2926500-Alexandrium_andersonii.AAC.2
MSQMPDPKDRPAPLLGSRRLPLPARPILPHPRRFGCPCAGCREATEEQGRWEELRGEFRENVKVPP